MGKILTGVCSFATCVVLWKIESREREGLHKCLGIKLRYMWLLIQISGWGTYFCMVMILFSWFSVGLWRCLKKKNKTQQKSTRNSKSKPLYMQEFRVLLQYCSIRNWYYIVTLHLLSYYDFDYYLRLLWLWFQHFLTGILG